MRGFPPLHLLVLAIAFSLVAVPLAQLTFARPQAPAMVKMQASTGTVGVNTYILLRFAHLPEKLTVKIGDQVLLDGTKTSPVSTMEAQAALVIPKEGIELQLDATWPVGTPDTAATIELIPDEKESRSQTHWSSGPSMSQIYSFTW